MSTAYAVLMCTPMLTTLLARLWLKERHPRTVYGLIVCGFAGVLICLHPGSAPIGLPIACVAFSCMVGAVRANLLRKAGPDETALSVMLFPCMAVNLVYMIPALHYAEPLQGPHFALLLLEGVLFTLGFLGTTTSYRSTPAAFAGMTHYSQIIWGILLGWAFFGNAPDYLTITGALVIIASGITLVWISRPKKVRHDQDIEVD
jgi:S-adenosylmethionine uptake transporter